MIAIAGLALVGIAGCSSQAGSPTKSGGLDQITISVTGYPTTDLGLPYLVGSSEGVFAKHGIQLKGIVPSPGGATTLRSVATGDIAFGDVAFGAVLTGFEAGSSVVVVGGSAATEANTALLTWPGSGVSQFSDMVGRKLGYSEPSSAGQYASIAQAKQENITWSSIKGTSTGGTTAGIQLLQQHQVDAMVVGQPTADIMAATGKANLVTSYAGLGSMQQTVIVTSPQVAKNTSLVKRFLAAYNESVALIKSDPAKAADLWVAQSKLDKASTLNTVNKLLAVNHWNVVPTVEGMNAVVASMQTTGDLKSGQTVDWKTLINVSLLPDGLSKQFDASKLAIPAPQP